MNKIWKGFATVFTIATLTCSSVWCSFYVEAQPVLSLENTQTMQIKDGTYRVYGRLWQANQPIEENWKEKDAKGASMADAALNHEMLLVVKDGKATLQVEFLQHKFNVMGEEKTGYLKDIRYHLNFTDDEFPKDKNTKDAEILQYWEEENGERITDDYGTDYPKSLRMELGELGQKAVWIEMYIPIMDSIMSGAGTQRGKIVIDWDGRELLSEEETERALETESVQETTQPETVTAPQKESQEQGSKETESQKVILDPKNLADGQYTVEGRFVKNDKHTLSMADNAIYREIELMVKAGVYQISMKFRGLTVGKKTGYLGEVRYFTSGYTFDSYGNPKGTLAEVSPVSYQTGLDGKKHLEKVQFEMVQEAKEDGLIPMRVVVPLMEAIAPGAGTQTVFLKLDWNTLQKADGSVKETERSGISDSQKQSEETKRQRQTITEGNRIYKKANIGKNKLPGLEKEESTGQSLALNRLGEITKQGEDLLQQNESVRTGDKREWNRLWFCMMAVSGGLLLILVSKEKRDRKKLTGEDK